MVDIIAAANQALLDVAEWAGVSVWLVIAAIVAALLNHVLVLMLGVYWFKRKRESSIKLHATQGEAGSDAHEFVEKTLMEFPADRIKIETAKGMVTIKLISQQPTTVEESLLPQDVKGEPLPSKVEEPKPSESKKPEPAPEKKPPESEPIPVGAVESTPEEQKTK